MYYTNMIYDFEFFKFSTWPTTAILIWNSLSLNGKMDIIIECYTPKLSILNLYTNTVLGGSVILSVCDSVYLWFCPFAIETTFPLSNFKTKHIFGILRERVTFLNQFGAPQAPPERGAGGAQIFFFRRRRRRMLTPRPGTLYRGRPWRPNFILFFFIAAEGGGMFFLLPFLLLS